MTFGSFMAEGRQPQNHRIGSRIGKAKRTAATVSDKSGAHL